MVGDIRFYTALSLENHPILNEKSTYKENYINALYYFFYKYSNYDVYAKKLLDKYNDSVNDDYKINISEETILKKSIKKVCGFKFKEFKLFTYRFVFICDCLFINAYDNPVLGKKILNEFKKLFNSRYHSGIDELYEVLYNDKKSMRDFKLAQYQVQNWIKNKSFIKQQLKTIVVTATMSAGKSTLINAIVGKNIVKTQNDSCTAKCYRIYEKAFEDNFVSSISDAISLNTDQKDLMKLNDSNAKQIEMATFMQLSSNSFHRLCIIDTPGVNSSIDAKHVSITHEVLKKQKYDKLLYLINAENIGSEDDLIHIRYIFDNLQHNKVVFVLNKLDRFRKKDDSISQSLEKIYNQLTSIGFVDPTIVPVSAFAGQLFKKVLCGLPLNEDENDECIMLLKKFSKNEFDLSTYYREQISWEGKVVNGIDKYTPLQVAECLRKSGLPSLEKLISRKDAK